MAHRKHHSRIGDDDAFSPNYGAGDMGAPFDPSLGASGGEDPFANVVQPFDDDGDPTLADGTSLIDDPPDDWTDPSPQVGTLRHPKMTFGGELYTGFGPAAVFGSDGAGHGLRK